jgi:glycosyl transferase, family 25
MLTHLINLDRSTERLSRFQAINAHLPDVIRFPAVDGRKLDTESLIANGTIDRASATSHYTPGAIGAALSHIALWTKAIDAQQSITVCEDDAIFNLNYAQSSQSLIDMLPADWDFILWGWNFDSNLLIDFMPGVSGCLCWFDQASLVAGVETFRTQDIASRPLPLLRAFGAPCYSVSPRGAQALKSACFPIRETEMYFPVIDRHIPNVGIDIGMNLAYPDIKAYAAFPPLVITKNEREAAGPHAAA